MIIIITILLVFLIFSYFMSKKYPKDNIISKSILVLMILSIIINIAVSQNYSINVIDGDEGYAITNSITYLLLGEDGWSLELFKNTYNISTYVSLSLLVIYSLTLLLPFNKHQRKV